MSNPLAVRGNGDTMSTTNPVIRAWPMQSNQAVWEIKNGRFCGAVKAMDAWKPECKTWADAILAYCLDRYPGHTIDLSAEPPEGTA